MDRLFFIYGLRVQSARPGPNHSQQTGSNRVKHARETGIFAEFRRVSNILWEIVGNGVLLLTSGHNHNGLISDGGYFALLKFKPVTTLQEYIRQVYLYNVEEAQGDLQYIKVEVSANASDISKAVLRVRDNE